MVGPLQGAQSIHICLMRRARVLKKYISIISVRIHTHIHTYMHTYMHACIYIHIYIHIYIYIYIMSVLRGCHVFNRDVSGDFVFSLSFHASDCTLSTSTNTWSCWRVQVGSQRTQYPLIEEYTFNYRGLNIMI